MSSPSIQPWVGSNTAWVGCLILLFLSTGLTAVSHKTVAALPVLQDTRNKTTEQTKSSAEEAIQLSLNQPVQKNIRGTDSQTLNVHLETSHYAEILFEWQGIDLEINVLSPDGSSFFPAKVPLNASGSLPISIIANQAGSYSFEVQAIEKLKHVGSYLITLVQLRDPAETDRQRAEATKLTLDALKRKEKQQAIETYLRALALWESAKDERGQAYTLQRLGNLYISTKDLPNAQKHFENAIEIRRRIGDARSLAYSIREIGADYRSFHSPTKAIEFYQKALAISLEAGDRRAESDILYSIGFAEARIGHMEKALGFYERALAIQVSDKNELSEARTLNSMGGAYDALSLKAKALSYYEQAAERFERLADRYRQAIVLNNIGLIHDDWGDYQTAKDKYNEAVSEFKKEVALCEAGASPRALNICNTLASTLDNLGELSNTLGDPESALVKFNESMAIRNLLNQPQQSGSTLSRICYSHLLLGNFAESLRYCQLALPLNDKAEDLRGSAYTLTFWGMTYASLNDSKKAQEYFERALIKQKEAGDRRGEGVTLDKLGSLYAANAQWGKAFESYERALKHWRDIHDPDGETITLYNMARAERDRANYSSALELTLRAVKIVETTRARLTSQQLSKHYFAGKQNYYDLQIDLNMRLASGEKSDKYLAQALETKERANARNLLDTLEEARTLRGNRTEVPGTHDTRLNELIQRQLVIIQNLNSKANAKRELVSRQHENEDKVAIDKEIEELVNEYDDVDTKIRTISPRYVSLVRPEPIIADHIKQQLDNDTLLLEYALGEKRSYAWVVSRSSIRGVELASREQIERLAHRVIEAVTARNRDNNNESPPQRKQRIDRADAEFADASAQLSKMVLEPVATLLRRKRLVVVADGALQLIPFQALPIPGASASENASASRAHSTANPREAKPLISEHEVITLPSASVLALHRRELANRKPAPYTAAIIADPVYEQTDSRLVTATKTRKKGSEIAKKGRVPKQGVPNASTTEEAITTKPNSLTSTPNPSGATPNTASANETSRLTTALRDVGIDGSLSRLPWSAREANAIAKLIPRNQLFSAVGFKANRGAATSAMLSKYRYIHFATHGIMDLDHPELSGIVFSMFDEKGQPQDGYLRLHEVYNLNLPAELVVLSACQTGVGKQIKGEGIIALTRGFMYAGAKSIVASLWKVDDAATAELMAEFYKQIFTHKLKPAAALRAAQLEIASRENRKSPYFWAGFFLQGEWN